VLVEFAMVNEEYCEKHSLFHTGGCGPCAREDYEKKVRKAPVFRYRVEEYDSHEEFEKEVKEAGKEGVEVVSHSVHTNPDSVANGEWGWIYTVVFRVHRAD
jgi:hypothetical protein